MCDDLPAGSVALDRPTDHVKHALAHQKLLEDTVVRTQTIASPRLVDRLNQLTNIRLTGNAQSRAEQLMEIFEKSQYGDNQDLEYL